MDSRYRIPPGSPLDNALNVLVAVELGEPAPPGAMSHAEAVDVVDAVAGQPHVMNALGIRTWMVVGGADGEPLTGTLSADEIERRWFGGEQVATS